MTRFLRICSIFAFAAMLGGCAVGVTHRYDNAKPEIAASSDAKLTIGVQDRRVYIVSGKKPETFVGLSRGGFGNAFDVNTSSGNALADDMAKSIQTALSAKGATVRVVRLPIGTGEIDAIKRLMAPGDKAVIVLLDEWKADTYMSTSLVYDVKAKIMDSRGKIVAEKAIAGNDGLGGSAIDPPEHSRNAVPAAFRRKLEELFASPEMASHL